MENEVSCRRLRRLLGLTRTSIRRATGSARKSEKNVWRNSRIATIKLITDVVALQGFKDLMKKNAGKLKFASD